MCWGSGQRGSLNSSSLAWVLGTSNTLPLRVPTLWSFLSASLQPLLQTGGAGPPVLPAALQATQVAAIYSAFTNADSIQVHDNPVIQSLRNSNNITRENWGITNPSPRSADQVQVQEAAGQRPARQSLRWLQSRPGQSRWKQRCDSWPSRLLPAAPTACARAFAFRPCSVLLSAELERPDLGPLRSAGAKLPPTSALPHPRGSDSEADRESRRQCAVSPFTSQK